MTTELDKTPSVALLREVIAMQALEVEALEASKEELRQMLIKARNLITEGADKYKVLFAQCEEQDKLLQAINSGDVSGLDRTIN